ncbi:MAG: TlyA family RNA methyltransferase [Acetatifactor sp.]|nr:TlyA family RNA methyltransferase [Acetatifactor sp.]
MKERLDVILVNQGYAASREKAKAIIMSGNVYVDGQREDKAGTAFDAGKIRLEVRGSTLRYVSRGGLKLEKAMDKWRFELDGKVCMDIGASTGGFTDCMLQNGAARVYSVDVGRGQLDWKLRNDPRVVCMEQTNFRYTVREDIPEELDFASVDVSFISLTKILIPARNLLKTGGEMVCLIKPQFEAGKGKVGKNGVVREPEIHREVIAKIVDYADSIGFAVLHLEFSPIKGPEGNIEYLLHIKKEAEPSGELFRLTEREAEGRLLRITEEKSGLSQREEWEKRIRQTVENSHRASGSGFPQAKSGF